MPGALDPHSQAADAVHEGRPIEAQYVRQGRRGTHVVAILVASLALVVLGFLAVWAMHWGPFEQSTTDNRKTPAEAAQFQAPAEPAVKQAPAPGDGAVPAAAPSGAQARSPQ